MITSQIYIRKYTDNEGNETPNDVTPSALEKAHPFECNKVGSRTGDVNADRPRTVVLISLLVVSSLAVMIVEESYAAKIATAEFK